MFGQSFQGLNVSLDQIWCAVVIIDDAGGAIIQRSVCLSKADTNLEDELNDVEYEQVERLLQEWPHSSPPTHAPFRLLRCVQRA